MSESIWIMSESIGGRRSFPDLPMHFVPSGSARDMISDLIERVNWLREQEEERIIDRPEVILRGGALHQRPERSRFPDTLNGPGQLTETGNGWVGIMRPLRVSPYQYWQMSNWESFWCHIADDAAGTVEASFEASTRTSRPNNPDHSEADAAGGPTHSNDDEDSESLPDLEW